MTRQFTVKTVRAGVTRVDWDRGLLVVRKPRPATRRDDLASFATVQAKRDGVRVVCAMPPGEPTHARVFTTAGHDLSSQYQLGDFDWYQRLRDVTPYGHVDAELHVPGKGREAVKTSLADNALECELAVFGCGHLSADASPEAVSAWCASHRLESLPYTTVGDDDGMRALHDSRLYDGVVYKTAHYGDWVKVKSRRTIDCVVTDVKMGVGKYWGRAGALVVGVYGSTREVAPRVTVSDGWRVIANVSGMDDDVRDECWPRERVIGRVCEVAYERVGSQGRLQHPRFVRWRDDKQSAECTADQDEDLTT